MKDIINNVKLQANDLLNELFRTREDTIYNFTENEIAIKRPCGYVPSAPPEIYRRFDVYTSLL